MQKIKDWIYRTLLRQQYLKWQKEGYNRGFDHAAEHYRLSHDIQSQKLIESWVIDADKVFSFTKAGMITLRGEQITEKELRNLKAEVRTFKQFEIYLLFINTVRKLAVDKAILQSTDLYSPKGNEQVLAGKMMVYDLDVLKTILERIDKAKVI